MYGFLVPGPTRCCKHGDLCDLTPSHRPRHLRWISTRCAGATGIGWHTNKRRSRLPSGLLLPGCSPWWPSLSSSGREDENPSLSARWKSSWAAKTSANAGGYASAIHFHAVDNPTLAEPHLEEPKMHPLRLQQHIETRPDAQPLPISGGATQQPPFLTTYGMAVIVLVFPDILRRLSSFIHIGAPGPGKSEMLSSFKDKVEFIVNLLGHV